MLFQQRVKSQDLDFILFLVWYRMYVFYESKIKGNNMGQGINSMSFLLKHFVFVGIFFFFENHVFVGIEEM